MVQSTCGLGLPGLGIFVMVVLEVISRRRGSTQYRPSVYIERSFVAFNCCCSRMGGNPVPPSEDGSGADIDEGAAQVPVTPTEDGVAADVEGGGRAGVTN